MIYAIFILAMCGIGAAIVASNKGRSGFGWLLIGFLLGPIGFILSLVVSKNTAVLEESAVLSGESRKCPYCAELVKTEAKICKHCGKDLPEFVPVSSPNSVQSIHDAVWDGNWSGVSQLIRDGADVNAVNEEGKTPLALAMERGDKQIIKLLESNGAKKG